MRGLTQRIWMYWDQGWDSAPRPVRDCAASWRNKNPEFEVVLLSRDTLSQWVALPEQIADLLPTLSVQLQTDVLRLLLLHQNGGIWADATTYCTVPLVDWLPDIPENGAFLFERPGPDRLYASWFIAARSGSRLIELWLAELTDCLLGLPNPSRPTGRRKLVQKILQGFWSGSVKATLNWWSPLVRTRLSVYPYFIVHYCFNRLALTNTEFQGLMPLVRCLPADPAHELQKQLSAQDTGISLPDSPVHKLNWRKLGVDRPLAPLIEPVKMGIETV